eukprot:1734195-Amphidinium_carterae.1
MLRFPDGKCVVRPQALEVYFEKFRELVAENMECWFLCVAAEDRARAEQMPRARRSLDHGDSQPWDEVFESVAMDDRYWDKEVRRPALAFVARGQANAMEALEKGLTTAPKRQPFSNTS